MEKILDVERLMVSYPGHGSPGFAVRGIDFEIRKHEILGIVGESGAGKTSICKALMGMCGPTARVEGEARLLGKNILNLDPKALQPLYTNHIALLPQGGGSLNPLITVGAHIRETIKIAWPKLTKKERQQKALVLLRRFGMPDPDRACRSFPFQLSGGMNQRVLLCLAFAGSPRLVLADEPTRSLDPGLRDHLLKTLTHMTTASHMGILLVTHDLAAAKAVCHRIGVIYNGRFVETGQTRDVLEHPRHPYTRALLQALPKNGMVPLGGSPPENGLEDAGCAFQPRCCFGTDCLERPRVEPPVEFEANHRVWCRHA